MQAAAAMRRLRLRIRDDARATSQACIVLRGIAHALKHGDLGNCLGASRNHQTFRMPSVARSAR